MDLLPWYIITPVHLGEQCYTFPLLLEIAQMFHAYWEAHRWPGCNWMVFHKVNTCMSPASKSRNNSCKCSKVCDFVIATKSWASPLPPNPHASLLAVNTLTSWCCLCCTLTLCGFHASPLFCWRVGLAPLSWAFWLLVGQREQTWPSVQPSKVLQLLSTFSLFPRARASVLPWDHQGLLLHLQVCACCSPLADPSSFGSLLLCWFPAAAVWKCHRLGGFKPLKSLLSLPCRLEVRISVAAGRSCLPRLLQVLAALGVPWLWQWNSGLRCVHLNKAGPSTLSICASLCLCMVFSSS